METGNLELVSVNHSQTGEGNGGSRDVKISANGRHVVFHSTATNLVASTSGIQPSNESRLFVRNLETATTYLVQQPQILRAYLVKPFFYGPSLSISSDGRFVAFEFIFYKNRIQFSGQKWGIQVSEVFLWDRETGQTRLVSKNAPLRFDVQIRSHLLATTPDGRFIVFTNSSYQLQPETAPFLGIFLYDVTTNEIEQIDMRLPNTQDSAYGGGLARISNDGRYVVFEHSSRNLTDIPENHPGQDIYIRDRISQTTRLVSSNYSQIAPANNQSFLFSISSDARFVVFASHAKDLILDHPTGHHSDVFVWDALNGSKICASRDILNLGSEPNGYFGAEISDKGDNVMIHTAKAPQDIYYSLISEVFVFNTITNQTNLISNFPGSSTMGRIVRPSISRDGRRIVFQTELPLLSIDNNNNFDIYSYSFGKGF
jgi:dipeptidyl aminopeptidase/acylaminoacyl peptidase